MGDLEKDSRKRYEVNGHLRNVRALINDQKTYGGATFAAPEGRSIPLEKVS